jgi:hypothetical protein
VMSVFEGMKRPRNDDHIISPNLCFEPLHTPYNRKKPANLKGTSQGIQGLYEN